MNLINQLRKGNLIRGYYLSEYDGKEYPCICEFLGFDPFTNHIWVNSYNEITDFVRFEPLEITIEALTLFGFFVIETGGKIEACKKNIRYNLVKSSDFDEYLFCDSEKLIINLNKIHELQNIWHSVTKQELPTNQFLKSK